MDNVTNINGKASFTRRAGTQAAWHRLGGETPENAPKEIWAQNSGMDFTIESAPVLFPVDGQYGQETGIFPNRNVLYRSDTHGPLSIVSNIYKPVQPIEILDTLDGICTDAGAVMDTAGTLGGGVRFWGLAELRDQSFDLAGDILKAFILIATSCDGSMATIAMRTAIRVVCENTLRAAMQSGDGMYKLRHTSAYDPNALRAALGIESWEQFAAAADRMASTPIDDRAAAGVIWDLFGDVKLGATIADVSRDDREKITAQTRRKIESVWANYKGAGLGAELVSAKGTRWGLLNAVTQFVDHDIAARSDENRLDSAWFGAGAAIKDKALQTLAA